MTKTKAIEAPHVSARQTALSMKSRRRDMRGGYHEREACRRSAGVACPDEADGTDADIELLHAAFTVAGPELGAPGDLDGISVVEDEKHRGFPDPDQLGQCLIVEC
jgi:hypothetical protein